MKRRGFLIAGGLVGTAGALVVGWGLLPARSRLGDPSVLAAAREAAPFGAAPLAAHAVALNGWLRIAPDGEVQLAMPRAEMGQGVHTALAQLVADELDVPLARVRLVEPEPASIYGNVAMFVGSLPFHPMDSEPGAETSTVRAARWLVGKVARELGIVVTGGSSTIPDAWEPLRLAAATARAQLLQAAAERLRAPLGALGVQAGVVTGPGDARVGYGELVASAAGRAVSGIAPKPPAARTLVGRDAPRLDVPAKVDGSARFGLDVRLPGLVYAVIRQGPAIGGRPGTVDASAARALPGVLQVVTLPALGGANAGVAVVGTSTWHARRGADALTVEWLDPPGGTVDSEAIGRTLAQAAREAVDRDGGTVFHEHGRLSDARTGAARTVEALYQAPYLAHVTLEPPNATARVADGRVEVWVGTQVSGMAIAAAARVAGVAPEAVTVHVTYLGGGFGRRLEVDVVSQAVHVAMQTAGRPVQLMWTREEDLAHDVYRPAAAAVLRAWLGADGRPLGLAAASAGDAIAPRWLERNMPNLIGGGDSTDKTQSEGLFDMPYAIAHRRIAHVSTRSGVPVGFWRSVGHSQNAFFAESFVDELAQAANADPVAFRLSLLGPLPRHAAVLRLAAERSGWGTPVAPGRARGVALHESFDSIVAQVAEVSIEPAADGRPARIRVHRVTCAADVGVVVNPGIVARQMESALVFGLTAALHGRIDITRSRVAQRNLPDQPLLSLADCPAIDTHLVPSDRAPGGVGEPGTPPIAPAVANAVAALTGRRLRELPLRLA